MNRNAPIFLLSGICVATLVGAVLLQNWLYAFISLLAFISMTIVLLWPVQR